ncbi:hypothetical protein [Lysinibacillus sp. FSL W7-1291]|uniref:hypothetical protein n=1 Tax=Lysinibacillus sp. FSL W7-1291 TaxID=2954544 RepID=UPI00315A5FAF
MEDNKKPSQVAGTTSEDINSITVQVSSSTLAPIYESISIAEEILDFSKANGWSKEQLLLAINIFQSLEHFS